MQPLPNEIPKRQQINVLLTTLYTYCNKVQVILKKLCAPTLISRVANLASCRRLFGLLHAASITEQAALWILDCCMQLLSQNRRLFGLLHVASITERLNMVVATA